MSAGENQSHINTGYLSTSSIEASDDCAKKRIRLGNDNYVISIQPFKEAKRKSIIDLNDLNESETDPPPPPLPLGIANDANNQPTYNRVNKTVIKKTIKTSSNSSHFCSCCRFIVDLLSLFIQCMRCFASCFCTPCCFATALFGGVFAVMGVGVFVIAGVIPLPADWTSGICNNNASQRNMFASYENVTVVDRLLTYSTTQVSESKCD